MNLLSETTDFFERNKLTADDIMFIGSRESGYRCSWGEFQRLADVEYDSGFGAQEVASDLEIIFRDGGVMWRLEYDGSEGWEYRAPFTEPAESKPITRLTVAGTERTGWVDLRELHEKPNY